MFKAYDVRGKYGFEVTEEKFNCLGQALNAFSDDIVLGMDFREHNDSLASSLLTGFDGEKLFLGNAPTPATAFCSGELGVSITASHNPVGYNGAKMLSSHKPFFTKQMLSLREEFEKKTLLESLQASGFKLEPQPDLLESYVAALPTCENGLFDLAGGAVCALEKIFPETVFSKPDPAYAMHSPEPTAEALSELIRLTRDRTCLGFAFDGDGDRLAVVDSGEFVDSNALIAFFASRFLKKNDSIVVTLDVSQETIDYLTNSGFNVLQSKIGDIFVLEKALEEKSVFSAEKGGHYTFMDFMPHSDGVYAACLLSETKPGEIRDFSKQFTSTALYDSVPVRVTQEKLVENALQLNPVELITVDGVKAIFEDYSFLIRSSNTEQKTRLMVESKNSETARKALEKAREIVAASVI